MPAAAAAAGKLALREVVPAASPVHQMESPAKYTMDVRVAHRSCHTALRSPKPCSEPKISFEQLTSDTHPQIMKTSICSGHQEGMTLASMIPDAVGGLKAEEERQVLPEQAWALWPQEGARVLAAQALLRPLLERGASPLARAWAQGEPLRAWLDMRSVWHSTASGPFGITIIVQRI